MTKLIRIISLIFSTVLIMANSTSQVSLDEILSEYGWKKRIVLLITDEEDISLINGVDSFFNKKICNNENRNLELYKIIGNEIKGYKIPKRYKEKKGIWLIGYDGGDKAYSRDLSLLEQIYKIIDKMPVRQNEMLNQNSNCD